MWFSRDHEQHKGWGCKERTTKTLVKTYVKGCRDDSAKTIKTRVLYADKGKDIWHEEQGAV